MKTLHYSIIAVLIFTAIIIVVIEFPLYRGPSPMMTGSKLYQEDTTGNNVTNPKTIFPHDLPTSPNIGLLFNGTQTSREAPFYVQQGQNVTLVVDVISDPTNLSVILYVEPHIGFTKTNGIDLRLSDTRLDTPGKVILYMSISKDASPNTYQTLVKANTTGMSLGSHFYVKVLPQNNTTVKPINTSISDTGITPMSANVTNTNFSVNYNIEQGQVSEIKLAKPSGALEILLQRTGNGIITIDIPRALIDARPYNFDVQFIVLVDSEEISFKEIHKTIYDRTLSIPFKQGSTKIEIIGAQAI